MDFKYLVESGTYSKDMLTQHQQAYLEGIEYVKDGVIDEFFSNLDIFTSMGEFPPTIGKIFQEINEQTLENLKQYIYIKICEYIVACGDENNLDK